jgi:hypothetical protein
MTPGARSTDLPRAPHAPRAVKKLTRTPLKRQQERRYKQISQTRWAWCGSSGAGIVPQRVKQRFNRSLFRWSPQVRLCLACDSGWGAAEYLPTSNLRGRLIGGEAASFLFCDKKVKRGAAVRPGSHLAIPQHPRIRMIALPGARLLEPGTSRLYTGTTESSSAGASPLRPRLCGFTATLARYLENTSDDGIDHCWKLDPGCQSTHENPPTSRLADRGPLSFARQSIGDLQNQIR